MTKFSINIDELDKLTKGYTYRENGNHYEREYGEMVLDGFPNSEEFWRKFITPITNRIDISFSGKPEAIHSRNGVDSRVEGLSALHYSIYLNLIYASDCLKKRQISFFENFYTHLGTVLDLAEEFLIQLYFIILDCEEKKTEILQCLSKEKFLELASNCYDEDYPSAHKYYLSKGKFMSIELPRRKYILDEYYGNSNDWKDYSEFVKSIRPYRNVFVHHSQIESIIREGELYVPKKTKIGDYKKWHRVFQADENKRSSDFTHKEQLMVDDFILIKKHLNLIWEKPIADFSKAFYTDKNSKLLHMYNLTLT